MYLLNVYTLMVSYNDEIQLLQVCVVKKKKKGLSSQCLNRDFTHAVNKSILSVISLT